MQITFVFMTDDEVDNATFDYLHAVARCTDQILRKVLEPWVLANDTCQIFKDQLCRASKLESSEKIGPTKM